MKYFEKNQIKNICCKNFYKINLFITIFIFFCLTMQGGACSNSQNNNSKAQNNGTSLTNQNDNSNHEDSNNINNNNNNSNNNNNNAINNIQNSIITVEPQTSIKAGDEIILHALNYEDYKNYHFVWDYGDGCVSSDNTNMKIQDAIS